MILPVPGLPIEQQPPPVLLRLCLWGEARGEPALGKLAICWVIGNRAKAHGKLIAEIILQPLQFSSFNADDPNRAQLLSAALHDPAAYAACDAVAELFIAQATADPTSGATHYFVTTLAPLPSWARPENGWIVKAIIGKQTFGTTA